MTEFKSTYESEGDIPEEAKHLFKEGDDGTWSLIPAGEIKTVGDTAKLQEALRKERSDHTAAKKSLKEYQAIGDVEDLHTRLAKLEELEAGDNGSDEEKIKAAVDARMKSQTAAHTRELEKLRNERDEFAESVKNFEARDMRRKIHDSIRTAATKAKVLDSAIDDAQLLGERVFEITEGGAIVTRDGVGVTPGLTPDAWLTEMQNTRKHWWPESKGAGAKGSGTGAGGGKNPFTRANWNLTEQGNLYRDNPEKAKRLAEAAGTTVGGAMPAE